MTEQDEERPTEQAAGGTSENPNFGRLRFGHYYSYDSIKKRRFSKEWVPKFSPRGCRPTPLFERTPPSGGPTAEDGEAVRGTARRDAEAGRVAGGARRHRGVGTTRGRRGAHAGTRAARDPHRVRHRAETTENGDCAAVPSAPCTRPSPHGRPSPLALAHTTTDPPAPARRARVAANARGERA